MRKERSKVPPKPQRERRVGLGTWSCFRWRTRAMRVGDHPRPQLQLCVARSRWSRFVAPGTCSLVRSAATLSSQHPPVGYASPSSPAACAAHNSPNVRIPIRLLEGMSRVTYLPRSAMHARV